MTVWQCIHCKATVTEMPPWKRGECKGLQHRFRRVAS